MAEEEQLMEANNPLPTFKVLDKTDFIMYQEQKRTPEDDEKSAAIIRELNEMEPGEHLVRELDTEDSEASQDALGTGIKRGLRARKTKTKKDRKE